MDKKLKDLKDEVLVVTNAAEGNTPHVVEDIEPEGGLKTRPLAGAKPSDQFMRVHRSYIVQPSKIRTIERNRIVFGKEYIPVSENYRQAFFDFLAEHSLLF